MLWTKANNFKPPVDIPVYVIFYEETEVTCQIFSEEEMSKIISTSEALSMQQDMEMEDILKKYRIISYWSFIPLLPPDEVMPHLTTLNYELEYLKKQVEEIKKEINSIPIMTSFQRQLEALQIQIAKANPDPYHNWKVKRLEAALAPLGNSGITAPPQSLD